MNKQKKSNLIYNIIGNPIRVKIIELLVKNEKMSFMELKRELKLSTGSIYHHLAILGDLVTQDNKKRYMLTEEGKKVYNKYIKENPTELIYKGNSFLELINTYVSGKVIFHLIKENAYKFTLFSFFIFLTFPFFLYQSQLELRLIFLLDKKIDLLNSYLMFITSLFVIYLIINLFSRLIFKSINENLSLFLNLIFSYIPFLIFSIIWFLDTNFLSSFLKNFLNKWFIRIIFFLFQIWFLIMINYAIHISKNISLEKSSIITLAIVYISLITIFIPF